jgi:DNA repair protein RecN (Recombination protein N)
MIKNLLIINFALIDRLEIKFSAGLNIITGETGAGKSIIVDALMLLLGERGSVDYIRSGENKAIIEGEFEIGADFLKGIIDDEFDVSGNTIILRRELTAKGTSRCFVNDTPVNVSTLKMIGDNFVDFHGQHQHQSLLNPEKHLPILDNAANLSNDIKEYSLLYSQFQSSLEEKKKLLEEEKNAREKSDIYTLLLDELERINPVENEDQLLESELKILENSEQIHELTNSVLNLASQEEISLYHLLVQTGKKINELKKFDSQFEQYSGEIDSILVTVNELVNFISAYHSNIQFDEARTEEIRQRLSQLKVLIRKYGSIEASIQEMNKLRSELSLIKNFEYEIEQLGKKIESDRNKIALLAYDLSGKRKVFSLEFSLMIEDAFKNLGIENGKFLVDFGTINSNEQEPYCLSEGSNVKLLSSGFDIVEFYLSANKGEVPGKLSDIASGGEVSRIMLAIKSIIASSDRVSLMIFDEIDTGISGRIAQKVGSMMRRIASGRQIIAITHLPQIAAFADHSVSVEKIESNGRTKIIASLLDNEGKVKEVAKLLSGDSITGSSLNSARELIETARIKENIN